MKEFRSVRSIIYENVELMIGAYGIRIVAIWSMRKLLEILEIADSSAVSNSINMTRSINAQFEH